MLLLVQVHPPQPRQRPNDADEGSLWPGEVVGDDLVLVQEVQRQPDRCLRQDDRYGESEEY